MSKKNSGRYLLEQQTSENIAKKTLLKIKALSSKHKIQADPIHFSLIYELLLNKDQEFAKEVQALIDTASYNHSSAQILFTNLWAKIIQRTIPYDDFAHIIDELLININHWVHQSKDSYSEVNKQITIAEKSSAEDAFFHIQQVILPHIKNNQEQTLVLQNDVHQISAEVDLLKNELNKATILARTDDLTGLPNKRGFNEFLKQAIENSQDKETNLSLVAFDIDFFKAINDEFGHLIGDSVLKYLAKIFREETKGRDLIARTGGEEFLLVLQDTDLKSAEKLANIIRKKLEKSKLHIKKTNQTIKLTISAGVSHYQAGEELEDFIDRADKALYASKHCGRNKVTLEETGRNSY